VLRGDIAAFMFHIVRMAADCVARSFKT